MASSEPQRSHLQGGNRPDAEAMIVAEPGKPNRPRPDGATNSTSGRTIKAAVNLRACAWAAMSASGHISAIAPRLIGSKMDVFAFNGPQCLRRIKRFSLLGGGPSSGC